MSSGCMGVVSDFGFFAEFSTSHLVTSWMDVACGVWVGFEYADGDVVIP